jgi:hypothetical protein
MGRDLMERPAQARPQPCLSQPELFFARDAASSRAATLACSYCDFQVECRLEGLLRREYGVWGGLSFNARVHMTTKERNTEIVRLQNVLAQKRRTS